MSSYHAMFEAASRASRASKWGTTIPGPNRALQSDLKAVRARSRKAVANNGYANSGVANIVSNMIGTGVNPSPNVKDEELKRAILALWSHVVLEIDASGMQCFAGMQTTAATALVASSEAIARRRPRLKPSSLTSECSHGTRYLAWSLLLT